MITIFCHFHKYLAKNGIFLKKTTLWSFFHTIILFRVKIPIFAQYFRTKIFLKS
jgi:hypothetical protein